MKNKAVKKISFLFLLFLVLLFLYSQMVYWIINNYADYLNQHIYNMANKFIEYKWINILLYSAIFSAIFTLGEWE